MTQQVNGYTIRRETTVTPKPPCEYDSSASVSEVAAKIREVTEGVEVEGFNLRPSSWHEGKVQIDGYFYSTPGQRTPNALSSFIYRRILEAKANTVPEVTAVLKEIRVGEYVVGRSHRGYICINNYWCPTEANDPDPSADSTIRALRKEFYGKNPTVPEVAYFISKLPKNSTVVEGLTVTNECGRIYVSGRNVETNDPYRQFLYLHTKGLTKVSEVAEKLKKFEIEGYVVERTWGEPRIRISLPRGQIACPTYYRETRDWDTPVTSELRKTLPDDTTVPEVAFRIFELTRAKTITTPKGTVVISAGRITPGTIDSKSFDELIHWLDGETTESAVIQWSPWERRDSTALNHQFLLTGHGVYGWVRQSRKNPSDVRYFPTFKEAIESVTIRS